MRPTVASPDAWAYRYHATFQVDGAGNLCFVGTDNATLIPIDECHILRPELRDLLAELNFEDVEGLTRVRVQAGSAGDLMLVLSTADDQAPELEVTMPVSVNLLLSDNEPVNLIGASTGSYTVRGRPFRVTAGGFFQVNLPQAEALVGLVLEALDLHGEETVLDLYAGVGLFTAFLAERAALVTSVESYPPAVSDADVNLADLDNVDLIEGSVEAVLPELEGLMTPPCSTRARRVDVAVLDALVRGAARSSTSVASRPRWPATPNSWPRTYRLLAVTPVDMFPQTYHIECVAHFAR